MKTYTIGFTKKNAETFFCMLQENNVKRLVDVRLNNVSQLAGFAKRDDLRFFLRHICDADYVHIPDLAPTKGLLDAYKKGGMPWDTYEDRFLNLMAQRNIERTIDQALFNDGCLLCSEHAPHHCHRRLVVDYLNAQWDSAIDVRHLF